MNQTQIDQEIRKEYETFNNSPYSGNPALPKDIMERFKKAMFHISPASHKMPIRVIQKITAKKLKDLTNIDVPIILNAISDCPLNILYKDLDEAVVKHSEIEELKLAFNLLVKNINEQTEQKRNNLMVLSGNTNGTIKNLAQA